MTILFTSCPKEDKYPYQIIITETPANLQDLNSSYDDYNSDLSYPASPLEIYFSSNRNSSGNYFDIIGGAMTISYHEEDDILNIDIGNGYPTYSYQILPTIQTSSNELGPYSFTTGDDKFVLVYANDQNGVFNFKYVYTYTWDWGHYNSEKKVYGPFTINILNSEKDEYYLTVKNEEIYFSSNRDDNFDIYIAQIPQVNDITSIFDNNDSLNISKDTILSSNMDDKCPFIYRNLIIFASNRNGGYGGYDLYYSQLIDSIWNNPINFGSKINSEYDEYRPITFISLGYNLMIFSSNRPGGKGGYDLYCVKIENLIE